MNTHERSEPNYKTEDTTHSVVEVAAKPTTNNDKISSSNKNLNKTDSSGAQNEIKSLSQQNQSSSNNSSNNMLDCNPPLSTFKSSSRENLNHQSQNHHQSHNDLNFSSLNDTGLPSNINSNQNLNALDLPSNRETYKSRKKIYQQEKKKLAEQLLYTLNDPTLIVLADWLKVRAQVKAWTKVWCELRPGLLVLYKSQKVHKYGTWVGTILLNITNVIERPSKKDGFCFKLYSSNDQNIWSKSSGPKGETFGAFTLPLPLSYLMFRATSSQSGNRWIRGIKLSLMSSKQIICNDLSLKADLKLSREMFNRLLNDDEEMNMFSNKNENDIEKEHFDQDLTDDQNSSAEYHERTTDSDTTSLENDFKSKNLSQKNASTKHHSNERLNKIDKLDRQHQQTVIKKHRINKSDQLIDTNLSSQSSQQDKRSHQLIALKQSTESLNLQGQTEYIYQAEEYKFGEQNQTEDVGEENKNVLQHIWNILKQVKARDLSKVTLPTYILEPRSFLEKLTDYYYHCDILANATTKNDPFERMKEVVRWYLSGFYKKPNGLKKPYNPILGEQFRCYWVHPIVVGDSYSIDENDDQRSDHLQSSKTFYVAEQISHHPPVTAWYLVNRHQGYQATGSVCVKSSYYGNSVSAILYGSSKLSLINRGEDYTMNFPYAHCKGILFGSLTFELGGKVEIKCQRTNYSCDLEFKLKPFLGGEMNVVYGKIKLGAETLATIDGHWDKKINIKEKRTGRQSTLWEVNETTFDRRLKRYNVPLDQQTSYESQKLWSKVSDALRINDYDQATIEKTKLEDKQRKEAKEREENFVKYETKLFQLDPLTDEWHYKYQDLRPWDHNTDILQYEKLFHIQTLTKHRTVSKANLVNANLSMNNCPELTSGLGSNLNHRKSNYSSLTPQKTNMHKRSPNSNKRAKSPLNLDQSNQEMKSLDDLFDSIDGDEEEDTDYSSTFKNTISSSKCKLNTLTYKLLKKVDLLKKNGTEFKESLNNLTNRQQKLEEVVLEKKIDKSLKRSMLNSNFFTISNLLAIFVLTVVIQLIIFKFNNYSRK